MPKLAAKAREAARLQIHPIVEFFPVDVEYQRVTDFIDTKNPDRKALRTALNQSKGIYAFYNSEMEVIYVGKSKSNLWIEMKKTFNRERNHYAKFLVAHPHNRYGVTADGLARPIRKDKFYLSDAAFYFSAYAIKDSTLIDLMELMIIRLIPNDLINVRMEGNKTLRIAKHR